MSRAVSLLLALAALVGGCRPGFEPTTEDDRAFALFGTLDGRRPVQQIRVQDLGIAVGRTPDRLPATVTSTELTSGVTTVWRDSLVTLADGTRGHLFVADLTVSAGEVHRIEAVRDGDGATSTVTLAIPRPTATTGEVGGAPTYSVRVDLSGLPTVVGPAVLQYRIRRPDDTGERDLPVPVTLAQTPPTGMFLALVGTASVQARTVLDVDQVELVGVRLDVLVRDTAPEPVERGVGGVGFVVPVAIEVPLPAGVVTEAGFTDVRGG